MGHLVGRICYEKAEEATNAVMTQVVPTIDKDGVLNHPVFIGSEWEYHGNQVKINFPQCNNQDFYDQGRELGQSMLLAFIGLFIVVVCLKVVRLANMQNDE
ncbi:MULTISPECIES: hypothetical protein [unclassified Neisseria]|jgi:hypothetical protein|uniref:hypothetical protein n=1 Tax=unclassified Neisseria TaxID=2623750 RepID=UPI00205B1143|nr:MAG TPA: hypothetical protein [Inoviridae sp.]